MAVVPFKIVSVGIPKCFSASVSVIWVDMKWKSPKPMMVGLWIGDSSQWI